jgi:hypothetical protein
LRIANASLIANPNALHDSLNIVMKRNPRGEMQGDKIKKQKCTNSRTGKGVLMKRGRGVVI